MPNFKIAPDGSSYSSSFYECFPFPEQEREYDIPSLQYTHHDTGYLNPSQLCTLPDSPPDSSPDHYSLPQGPHVPPIYHPNPGYIHTTPAGVGASSSSVIPIPQKSSYTAAVPHYPYANKRFRGHVMEPSSHSSSSASPLSMNSFKQEDDRDLDFSMSSINYAPVNSGGVYYHQSTDESIFQGSSEEGHRNIVFNPIFSEQWCQSFHRNGDFLEPASVKEFKVQADKGFNFSQVCV